MGASPAVTGGPAVLKVGDLSVSFRTRHGVVQAVSGVSFEAHARSTTGVVGESGSGKSVTALSIMRLLGANARTTSGQILFDQRDLLDMSESEMRSVRGGKIGMIFQEPRRSLDPSYTVGEQIAEAARRHLGLSRRAAWKRAVESLDRVQIPSAAKRAGDYPHQFSGGMCQRVMLAAALVCEPKLLIADEPTTALDVIVQARILDVIKDLQSDLGIAVLLISHDLGVIAEMAEQVVVMYCGQVVESGPTGDVFARPEHPYTEGLLQSIPRMTDDGAQRLTSIPGFVPSLVDLPSGCLFNPRCTHAVEACREAAIPLVAPQEGRGVRCRRWDELSLEGWQR